VGVESAETEKGKMKYCIITLWMLLASVVMVHAQQPAGKAERQKAKAERQKEKAEKEVARQQKKRDKTQQGFLSYKTAGRVYVFGVSQTLGENQVYVTDIVAVDSLDLQKKTKFLPYRSLFSLQLQQYTEGTLGQVNQTTSIFFSKNEKKLQKRLLKVKRHVLSNPQSTLTLINQDQFRFVHPLDMMLTE